MSSSQNLILVNNISTTATTFRFELESIDVAVERLGEDLEDGVHRAINVKLVHLKS